MAQGTRYRYTQRISPPSIPFVPEEKAAAKYSLGEGSDTLGYNLIRG